jgi:CRP-like cAMP-binding protein
LQLFAALGEDEILWLLQRMQASELHFEKEQVILEPAKHLPCFSILVQGQTLLMQEDLRGNRSILGGSCPGDVFFCNAFVTVDGLLPYTLHVHAKTVLILFDYEAAMTPGEEYCAAHAVFMRNLTQVLVQKQARLLHKVEYLSKRTTREKLLSYLAVQAARQGSRKILVPYTRQELADFLSVDRSAMCTELGRMQSDGLIHYDRHRFELLG